MSKGWIAHWRANAPNLRALHRRPGPSIIREPMAADRSDLLDRATALAAIGAWECDLATDALTWTTGVFNLFGLPDHTKVDRRDIVEMYCDESREAMEWLRADTVARRRPFTLDAQIARPDGARHWMRLSASVACRNGRPVTLFGLKRDITEERSRWEAMRQLVERDSQTGLSNRTAFDSRFLDAPISAPDVWPLGALILLHVDGLGQVHDRNGAIAGMVCLEMVAARLSAGFGDALMVARVGDDRFAVLTRAHRPIAHLEHALNGLLAQLATPIFWNGQLIKLHTSLGIALAENPFAYDAAAMLATAEAALATATRSAQPADLDHFIRPVSRPG